MWVGVLARRGSGCNRMTTDDCPDIAPRDLFLARDLSDDDAHRYLARRGFQNPLAGDEHLQQLADDLPTRLALGELADLLLDSLLAAPDPDAALVGFCRYVATRAPKSSTVGYLHDDPRALQILTYLLGASSFLTEILVRNPEYFHWLQRELDGPAPDLIDYRTELDTLLAHDPNPDRRLDAIKRFKRREMLRIASRDLLEKDTLRSSTEQLSNLADIVTEGALQTVRDQVAGDDDDDLPGRFVVIGLGKLGGRELNYSSDIDLIYVYEPDDPNHRTAHERFQKLGRQLTRVLGEHTDAGYFYRVDLRLRPMSKRGNIAYSLSQSRQYYETLGETFERFAMIKARPIAGDLELGQRFIEMVRPFVYRKYLDHAALEELARYKGRSDREHQKRESADRNVKVGRGGIREIELFTQVFQLIDGGPHPELQTGNTMTALERVHRLGFVEDDVLEDLTAAYVFLRTVEHRLQVVQEGQTHTLSDDTVELTITARRLGYDNSAELLSTLATHRARVHAVYTSLFEHNSEDTEFQGRQFFRLLSGELSEEDATAHLASLDLPDPETALQAILALDNVPTLAHSKTSTRNLLANLLATILGQMEDRSAPTQVLNRLEQVVTRARAPAALYRSLLENDQLRDRLLLALDTGDLFAQRLGRYPELLDFLMRASVEMDVFRQSLHDGLQALGTAGLDQAMDPFRRFKTIEEFKVLVEWLTGGSLPALNQKLSLLADTTLNWAVTRAQEERQTDADQTGWVVCALGKLGGLELTIHSDLDLVFLYEGDPADSPSFERQQAVVRTIHEFLEKPTAEGFAYHLDTRLRPEGQKGALAVPIVAFRRYLDRRAETWERMAWTRYRQVTGTPGLADEVSQIVQDFVYGPWNANMVEYARHLRSRMERELSQESTGARLDLKLGRGGLVDIDFLLQLLQIREGSTRDDFRVAGTRQLLEALPETQYLDSAQADRLRRAYAFLRKLETVVRIESDSGRSWLSTDTADLEAIAHRVGVVPATGEEMLRHYRETTNEVRAIFEQGLAALERS